MAATGGLQAEQENGAVKVGASKAMQFMTTRLDGVRLIELEPNYDERGFFARTFCEREFSAEGLVTKFAQHGLSLTKRAGSVRGMHYQRDPHAEVKLIRCVAGAIHDVLIDLRPSSPTYLQWEAYLLSASNRRQLYAPAGFAHGFQTLEPNTEVGYLLSAFYAPEASTGIRHDDPAFAIPWPLPFADISERDRSWPGFSARI
jgi:dTDP-4-dehydrorhamnose 3,5-epimerase